MELGLDLSVEVLEKHLPGRPVRSYPAMLSTEAEAVAWARADAPEGALVVADYQAAARGRGGKPWSVPPGRTLAFSIVLRPALPAEREGWLYTVAASTLADVVGPEARIAWPDEVRRGGERAAAVGVSSELGPRGMAWAVVSLLLCRAPVPRAPQLARVVAALEVRYACAPSEVLASYLPRCETIGRRVRAFMIPAGPAGPQVTGQATTSREDGALVIAGSHGRSAVRPQDLGWLEEESGVDLPLAGD